MKSFKLHVILVTAIQACCGVTTQAVSTLGRKFIVYPPTVDDLWDRLRLYITSPSPVLAEVQVQTPLIPTYKGGLDERLNVSKDTPITLDIPPAQSSGTGSQDKQFNGFQVTCPSADIAVFVSNPGPGSSAKGVTSLISFQSLGMRYLFPTIPNTYDAKTSILIGSSGVNSTSIKVTLPPGPGVPTLVWKSTEYGPGQTFTVAMNANEFVNIRQQTGQTTNTKFIELVQKFLLRISFLYRAGVGDLTGTLIESEDPVAVFSVSVFSRDSVDGPFKSLAKDITVENVPPLGRSAGAYIISASPSSVATDHIRVLAGDNNVTVTFSNGSRRTLRSVGDFMEDDLNPGDAFALWGDKAIQVIQYRYMFGADSAPFMFHVPSVDSFSSRYDVPILFQEDVSISNVMFPTSDHPAFTPRPSTVTENYLVLMTHACHADRVTLQHSRNASLNGSLSLLLPYPWRSVPHTTFLVAHVKVAHGFVTLSVLESDDPGAGGRATFGGFFFGRGPEMSYAAPLGLGGPGPTEAVLAVYINSTIPDGSGNTGGKSRLLSRGKLPLALPLTTKSTKSRVACHSECLKRKDCFFVAYEKAAAGRSQDKGERTQCTLYGRTAQCSGQRATGPDILLYQLDK